MTRQEHPSSTASPFHRRSTCTYSNPRPGSAKLHPTVLLLNLTRGPCRLGKTCRTSAFHVHTLMAKLTRSVLNLNLNLLLLNNPVRLGWPSPNRTTLLLRSRNLRNQQNIGHY
ncbi:hypothetical protein V8G54_018621 [Vigna mungo]|uniref:Uncharacterized protein n=1 Tax=Vigna mungo TaxID=3915 RepID=A0AAQ3NA76_VIGMU